jgi:antitoxin YefM
MDAISYTAARANLAKIMDKVRHDHTPIMVTQQNADAVVILSHADYQALEETAYLLRSPANAARLAKSIKDVEAKRVLKKKLTE